MRLLQWLLWSCVAVTSSLCHDVQKRDAASSRVVCYYTNWSVYRPGTAKFSPQNINPYLCTHLIYAFGGLSRENGLRPYDKYQDIEQGGYAKFTGLKTYNKQLKTLLAIGGWNEGSARFSSLVADEERRAEFVKNVVRFLRQNHFDGLDLDWEYPAFRDGGKPRDRENYALLVQELREEFEREHSKTGRPRLLLTMAVPAGIEYIDKGYDIPKLNRYLDFMNILSYDYHSAFEPSVNHHSPLYPLEEENEYNFDTQLCIDFTVKHLVELGADRDKLVLGIPTYGRSYTLFNADATEIGAPADGPGEQGDATREKGYLAYYEICENLEKNDWQVEKPNPQAMGPYAYKDNQWVGYDDQDIVRLKAKYVTENKLGGIMFWAIDNDDFRGKCHGRPYPLIEAGKEAMLSGGGLTNEVSQTAVQRPTKVSSSGGRPRNRKRKNKNRQSSSTTTSTTRRTTAASSSTPKYTTPEPPTTPDPGSDFKCKDEGFFPHPRDCKKYFWCLDSGPSNLGIVAHQFTCPSGLVFNKAADSCDYSRNVICKNKAKTEATSTTTGRPVTTASSSRATRPTTRATTTTTTTTTTTPEPEEEYEEYEDEDEEEDPKVIQELINLIKKLGGVEQLERQLQLQERAGPGGDAAGISRSLYNKVLARTNSNTSNRGPAVLTTSAPPQDSSTRYTSIFRNRPRGPQNEGLEETPARFERPKYVTIQRNRPSTPAPEAEEDEDLDEDDYDIDDEEQEEEDDDKVERGGAAKKPDPGAARTSGREYVNIRRERPQARNRPEQEDVTTPKYVTIQRHKSPPEEGTEEQVDEEAPEATVESPGGAKSGSEDDLPETVQDTAQENTPKYTPAPKRPSRLNTANKKGRKDTETVQEVEQETEAPVVKVSAERQYLDAASIRSGPRTSSSLSEDSAVTTAYSLTEDSLPTATHRQLPEAADVQVSDVDVPSLNNYLDTTRFRSATDKPGIYLDSPLPSEYPSDGDDEHEVNVVVVRSPAPVTRQIDYTSSPVPASPSLTTSTGTEWRGRDSSFETLTGDGLDTTTTSVKEHTEETPARRRGTTLPTSPLTSSTTSVPRTLARHSFSPRRRSTTTPGSTTTTDRTSVSTPEYSVDIPLSYNFRTSKPTHHYFYKPRKNSTVFVNANDILTPNPITTESTIFAETDHRGNVNNSNTLTDTEQLSVNKDYTNFYLTTTETQLYNTSKMLEELNSNVSKSTTWVQDSNTYANNPETSVTSYSSLTYFDNITQLELFENTKEQNVITTNKPKTFNDANYASVTNYRGLPLTNYFENANEQNVTIPELTTTTYNDNSVFLSDNITRPQWLKKDILLDDKHNKTNILPNQSTVTNRREHLPTTVDQPFTEEEKYSLQDQPATSTTTTTKTVTPTELYFDSETSLTTVIETVPSHTTRFTPTVTRVVTSVTESGTTERQRIAVNRVPYRSLIAALRAKQLTPSSYVELYDATTFPGSLSESITDIDTAPATTQPSTSGQRFRYITTADVFSGPPEPKVEKIMEVNRITTVTAKEDGQSLFSGHFTREQTSPHPDVQGTDSAIVSSLDSTAFTTRETEILATTEQNLLDNSSTAKQKSAGPSVGADNEDSATSYNKDTTTDSSTEGSSPTTATTSVSTLVERARTRSPGFRRRTTERTAVSKSSESPSTISGYRKTSRSRNRHYKPSTTEAPKQTEDPVLVKLRRVNRPLSTSRLNGSTARKPGGFSRRRIYKPSSTTETSSVSLLGNPYNGSDSGQNDYTIGRTHLFPAKSTTEQTIVPETLETGQIYFANDSNTTESNILLGDSEISLELTTLPAVDLQFSTNMTFKNDNIITSTQRTYEESSKHYSLDVNDKVSNEKLLQESTNVPDSTIYIITTTATFKLNSSNYSESRKEDELSDTVHETQFTLNNPRESIDSPSLYSAEFEGTSSAIDATESSRAYSTEEPRNRDFDNSFVTFTEETTGRSIPTVATEEVAHEPRTRNLSNAPTTTNEFASEIEPSARPHRKKMVVKKRRRRPPQAAPSAAGESEHDEINQVSRQYKEDKDVIREKGESLATLEDTNRNFISTESSPSSEFYTTVDDRGNGFVKLSVINQLNHPLFPGALAVTGDGYIDSPDYDYSRYSSRENYDSITTTNPDTRFTSRDRYGPSETSNEVQNDARVLAELSGSGSPGRKPHSRPSIAEVTANQGGRGAARFQTHAKTPGKDEAGFRRRKVVRTQRPDAEVDGDEEQTNTVNITTRPFGRQRQPGTLFNPRQRQRPGSTTSAPPAYTTSSSSSSDGRSSGSTPSRQPSGAQRRVVKRRKFTPRAGLSTTEVPQPLSTSPTSQDATKPSRQPVLFPKRRVLANDSKEPATPGDDALVQPSARVEDRHRPSQEAEEASLADLAHPAVAAIARLATHQEQDEETVPTTTTVGPRRGQENTGNGEATSTELVGTSPSPTRPARILPARRLTSKPPTTSTPLATSEPPPLRRQPLKPRPFVKLASPAPRTQAASLRSATPRVSAAPLDYEYYDDEDASLAEGGQTSSKVKVHEDGYIECLDRGNFPHPYSCKKFISCAKMESGGLLGWEYTCPRQLSFDPVGGICNWSAGLGCKE